MVSFRLSSLDIGDTTIGIFASDNQLDDWPPSQRGLEELGNIEFRRGKFQKL